MTDSTTPIANSSDVLLDLDRQNRTGLTEAIYCEGKLISQLQQICQSCVVDARPMLLTRLTAEQYAVLKQDFAGLIDYDALSRTGIIAGQQPSQSEARAKVAIVTAGSSDVPVAREAARTLEFYRQSAVCIDDIGVAGLWRLNQRLPELRQMQVVICIAGFDAALPTVLGGLIKSSIIAVPTSVGYGMAKAGETALAALLVSCAPGLVVVNIDNGFGAACAAMRITNQLTP